MDALYDVDEMHKWILKTLATYYASGNERMVFVLPFSTWIDTYAHGMVAPEHFSFTQIEVGNKDNYLTVKEKVYEALRGLGYSSLPQYQDDRDAFSKAVSNKPTVTKPFWRRVAGGMLLSSYKNA